MKKYCYWKVWQGLGHKDTASCAQQAYKRTFCLMHGPNLRSNENYGLGHSSVLCKSSASETVSQFVPTNVCAVTTVIGLAPQRYGPINSRLHGHISEGTRAQAPLKMCASGTRGEKRDIQVVEAPVSVSRLTVWLLLESFFKYCRICAIHGTKL